MKKPTFHPWIAILVLIAGRALGVEFSTENFEGKRIVVCRVNVKKERLQLFHRDENGKPFNRFARLAPWVEARGQKLAFAMNGGMYHGDFSAVGLAVAEGKELVPLNLNQGVGNFFLMPNGVFAVTEAGARVVTSAEYPRLRERERVLVATQSGPLLLRNGNMHPAFRAGSANVLHRNGVGVPSPEVAILAITDDPINFHDFARFFRDKLKCPDALFLDGTISSLHAPKLNNRSDFRMDLGPIPGVTE